jgi:hypothetical protein
MRAQEAERRFTRPLLCFEWRPIQGDRAMNFRIQGLSPQPFLSLYGLSDEELAERGCYAARIERA